jgi:type II secretory pathway component PulF
MTLDDLIALNDEIAALVRAGVPLESGLAAVGADMPGRLGKVATDWAARTARGEPLEQAIMQDAGQLPPAYRAVVQAGLRAGRLPAALEAVAASARRLVETHRAVVAAVTYPVLVFLVAWGGLVFFSRGVAPSLALMFASFHVPGQRFVATVASWGQSAIYWGPAVPIVVVLLWALWWFASTRANSLHSPSRSLFGWLPWVGPMLRWSQTATFLEILTLLVENQTPLEEAVILAAQASGDPQTLCSAQRLAAALRQGRIDPARGEPAFPPLIAWLMLAARRDGALLPALRNAAAAYHRRARHYSDMARTLLPVLLTLVIGGTITALYALSLFVPYTTMLRALAGG